MTQPTQSPRRPDSESEHTTTERWASAAHQTVDRMAQTANHAEEEMRDAAAKTAERARELRARTTEKADESFSKAKSYVAENPFTSAAIAFAAGVIVTGLFRRR